MKKSKTVLTLQNRARELKISQKYLSDMMGITPATMSRYMSGQRQPDIDQIERMARALGCTIVVAIR